MSDLKKLTILYCFSISAIGLGCILTWFAVEWDNMVAAGILTVLTLIYIWLFYKIARMGIGVVRD